MSNATPDPDPRLSPENIAKAKKISREIKKQDARIDRWRELARRRVATGNFREAETIGRLIDKLEKQLDELKGQLTDLGF